MSDEPKIRSRAWISWTVAALLVLAYPLSFGPVFWICVRGPHDGYLAASANAFYAPLFWVCNSSQTLSAALAWYVELFAQK
jgi:hypothetical protein